MKKITQIAIAVLFSLMTLTAAQADGWERNRVYKGPYGGTAAFNGKGYCNDYGCKSKQSWRGPNGGTVTRKGKTYCHDGYCESSAKWTGPRGKTWSRNFRFRRH